MYRNSNRLALVPCVAWLLACSHSADRVAAPSPKPEPLVPGVVYGFVKEVYSENPINGAQVEIEGTTFRAYSDTTGRYWLGPVPPGTYNVRVRMITYSPSTVVAAVSDTARLRLDVHLSYPGAGPLVDSSLFFPIWASVVSHYRPHEAEHIRAVTGLTGVAVDSSNTDATPVVLMLARELRQNSYAKHILDSLVVTGIATGVCDQADATTCPGGGFTTFLSLGQPHQQSEDAVAVPLVETAINPAACRRHQESFGGINSVTLQLLRRGSEWLVVGPIGVTIAGSVICGH